MARIESKCWFKFLINVKKRPYMYLTHKCMSNLADLENGFYVGYIQCCIDNNIKNDADNSLWTAFINNICDKYDINSPWYNELIEKCGSDEDAYNVFMDEMELFVKTNDIEVPDD